MDFTVFGEITAIIISGIAALCGGFSDAFSAPEVSAPPAVRSSCTLSLGNTTESEVVSVTLDGADNANVTNMNVNVLHSGVVGLFGDPVEISAEEFDGAKLTFRCNPDSLSLLPAGNLIVLNYDESYACYNEVPAEVDSEEFTVTLPVSSGGVYLLADGYEWYSVRGEDTDRFEAHDTLLSNSDYTPKFELIVPKEFELRQGILDRGQDINGFDYVQFAATGFAVDPSFVATFMQGEGIWQFQCDSFSEAVYTAERGTKYSILDYTLQGGAQARLYLMEFDMGSRGGAVGASFLLHVKVSDDKLLSFSCGVTQQGDADIRPTIDGFVELLRTFTWVEQPEEEAFLPAQPWDISEHPELTQQEPPVQLTEFAYAPCNEELPRFTMSLPDCVEVNSNDNPTGWEDENGITARMLGFCNQAPDFDIYYDFELYSAENMWQRRLEKDSFVLRCNGAHHTVEDISAATGCPSELYILRFEDTGGAESNHLRIYVFGFYQRSETEVVAIRCDLWADVEDEYLPLVLDSMRSFRFTE